MCYPNLECIWRYSWFEHWDLNQGEVFTICAWKVNLVRVVYMDVLSDFICTEHNILNISKSETFFAKYCALPSKRLDSMASLGPALKLFSFLEGHCQYFGIRILIRSGSLHRERFCIETQWAQKAKKISERKTHCIRLIKFYNCFRNSTGGQAGPPKRRHQFQEFGSFHQAGGLKKLSEPG